MHFRRPITRKLNASVQARSIVAGFDVSEYIPKGPEPDLISRIDPGSKIALLQLTD